jgi:serine/threonine protein kinase
MYFIAPEMLRNPSEEDGRPADVYSLAKTLWVLAAGQKYPPPGEQRVDIKQINLGEYVAHPRVSQLDHLIERATNSDPKLRPSMREIAAESVPSPKKSSRPPQKVFRKTIM